VQSLYKPDALPVGCRPNQKRRITVKSIQKEQISDKTDNSEKYVLKHLTMAPQISQTVRPFISSSLLLLLLLPASVLMLPDCFDTEVLLDRFTHRQNATIIL